ncbi:MAG: FIG00994909: hypothetical protein, partial [uncultured Blastococcus sp.]
DGPALLLRHRVHRGRHHHRPRLHRRRRRGRARVLRGEHPVRPGPGDPVGAAQRPRPAPAPGRQGLAQPRADPRGPARLPHRAGRGDRALGLVRRLRPRGAVPAVGRDAGPPAAPPTLHPRAPPALGRLRAAGAAAQAGGHARRAGRRPLQPRALERDGGGPPL